MIFDFEPGDKVVNPNNKEWGVGQIQSIIKEKITVYLALASYRYT
jgi:RNA polymerase-interacting CarD/CdnL/TRCF family regulator